MSSASSYGAGARLLHHLALCSRFQGEMCFDIDLSLHKKKLSDSQYGRHVFVAGLARAGTTLLMRMLYGSGEFASLTYRDMPFVMAPNLWAKLTARSVRNRQAEERAHGDGVMVDFDSPEALEEVFWRVYCEPQYKQNLCLVPMQADSETIQRFRHYIALINYRYQCSRYLSKNNNNLLRLPTIKRAFPNSQVLVPFREPVQHAHSLLAQHRKFSGQQRQESFTKSYMKWLGHHEFGLEHRPFVFDGQEKSPALDPDSPDYWLQQWVNVYTFILGQFRSGKVDCRFVSYEKLCRDPADIGRVLGTLLEMDATAFSDTVMTPSTRSGLVIESAGLREKASEIYIELSSEFESKLLNN